jgi:choline dehydrogenase-like flavoprotein
MRDAWVDVPGVDFPRDGSDGRAGVISVPTSMDPKNYTRSYARTGHYDRVKNRPNYSILTGHKVVKINFSTYGRSITATSVSIISRYDNTSTVTVLGKREIVLSAGSIHSPQILQRSGIGARATLDAANISQVLELPGVGQNFHDHPWFYSPTYKCEFP